MRPIARLVLAAFLILAVSCVQRQRISPPAPISGLSAAGFAAVTEVLVNETAAGHIAGAVALVARDGAVAYQAAVGDQDTDPALVMRHDTIFRIASMSKPIVSVAAMMLVERGMLSLDDPLRKYIPAFASPKVAVAPAAAGGAFTPAPAPREITVHDLLTHTSGITYRFLGHPYVAARYAEAGISDGLSATEGTLADMMERLGPLPLRCPPGEAWEYGLSIDVLGRVIEIVAGMPLDRFLRERIFDPLGMRDTHFFLPPEKLPRLAAVYTPNEDGTVRRLGQETVVKGDLVYSSSCHYRGPRSYFSGGAGLVSTAPDYARFLQMMLNGGVLDGARLLEPETVALMTSNRIGGLSIAWPVHGDKFGYGFGVVSPAMRGTRAESVGTYSWGGFYYTDFWVDPEEKLIGILMTQLQPSTLTLREDFRAAVYAAIIDRRAD